MKDFTIIGLEKLYKDDMYRKNRENLWKKKLNIFYPYESIQKKFKFTILSLYIMYVFYRSAFIYLGATRNV